jgi:secondary thiamine-phosphate synthase enzyme
MVVSKQLVFKTRGRGELIDITREVAKALSETDLGEGIVTVFVGHSTAGITTIEYEPGAILDFQHLLDRIAPINDDYEHNRRAGDDNGYAHVRAALVGPSVTVPFSDGRLQLGTWQQIVLADFDSDGRSRTVRVQVMGE